ncbi:MAG TPA: hypothetical protein VLH56_11000 [Dissulfurispiraceae bacterium]|nr:hypothetical protein [Dissulfurispiraceae bacterium]
MTTNLRYEKIIASMPAGLERKLLTVLSRHVGNKNRITRRDLVAAVFPLARLGARWKDSTEDRQVRRAISTLRDTWPILSDSGDGGYWLGTEKEIEVFIVELESRRSRLAEKIRALRTLDPNRSPDLYDQKAEIHHVQGRLA